MNHEYVVEPKLTGIWVGNFKCFHTLTLVPFGDLTLLYGVNGTGKSSLLQAVGLLHQLLDIQRKDFEDGIVMLPGDKPQALANLVADSSRPIEVGFRFTAVARRNHEYICSSDNDLEETKTFLGQIPSPFMAKEHLDYIVRIERKTPDQWSARTVLLQVDGKPTANLSIPVFDAVASDIKRIQNLDSNISYTGEFAHFCEWAHAAHTFAEEPPKPPSRDSDEFIQSIELACQDAYIAHRNAFGLSLARCGPERQIPKSARLLASMATGSDPDWWDILIQDGSLLQNVNSWLNDPKKLDLDLELRSVPGNSLELTDRSSGRIIMLRETASGYSYLLPILAESLSKGGNLIAQQPELHLHPRLQTVLGDLFLERLSEESRGWTVVETHSEHLLLRILRRLREEHRATGTYGARQARIAVVCMTRGLHGVRAERIGLSADGSFLDPWPDGFFDEDLEECL